MITADQLTPQDLNFLKALKQQGVSKDDAFARLSKVKTKLPENSDSFRTRVQAKTEDVGLGTLAKGALSGLKEGFNEAGERIQARKDIIEDIPTDTLGGKLKKGFETIKNIPQSALDTIARPVVGAVEGAVSPILSPILSEGFKELPQGVQDEITEKIQQGGDWFKTLSPMAQENLRSIGVAAEVVPVGAIAKKGANIATKSVKEGIETASQTPGLIKETAQIAGNIAPDVADAAKSAIKTTTKPVTATAKYVTSQATGLSPDTVSFVKNAPDLYEMAAEGKISRESLGKEMLSGIKQKQKELKQAGDVYATIKNEPLGFTINKSMIKDDLFKSFGITEKNGTLDFTKSTIGKEASKSDIKKAYDLIKQAELNTVGDIIALRGKLDDFVDYNALTTKKAQAVIKKMRRTVDDIAKENKALAVADSAYAKGAGLISKLRKDYLNPDGTLKDSALSKLANLDKKGKDAVLERAEKVVPGIKDKIQALSAFDDVINATGQKVGTYVRGGAIGAGIATMNIPVVIGGLLTMPKVAVSIIKRYGRIEKAIRNRAKKIINKINTEKPLTLGEKELLYKATESVEPNLIRTFITDLESTLKDDSTMASRLQEGMSKGFKTTETIPKTSEAIETVNIQTE